MTQASHSTDFDLHSIDDVMRALYASISGPPGSQDWSLSRSLFDPCARMVRTGLDETGKPALWTFSLSEYETNVAEHLSSEPFYEIEIDRHIERFGNIANVFSVYEAKRDPSDPQPFKRGLNMIHLYDDGARWWIMHMIWDNERDGLALPEHLHRSV